MTLPTRALSVRAPWDHAILHLGKDVENRNRPHSFRGPLLIHTSTSWQLREVVEAMGFIRRIARANGLDSEMATRTSLYERRGKIVGMVDVVDCVTSSDSPWFFGEFGFTLANPRPLPEPAPCRGMLGFFPVPPDVLERVHAQLRAMGVA